MKSEFALAFNEILERSGLARETVIDAIQAAMVSAYRRSVSMSSAQGVEARIDLNTGEAHVFVEKEVVESVENPMTEVSLEEARAIDPEVQLGDVIMVDVTPKDFGRVAAQTAKQVILQRLREAERDAQYEEFVEREGDMVHGTVHSISPQAVTIGLGRAEAILPRNQQIPGERFRVRDRVRVYVLEVRKSTRGPVIVVSRSHPHMLRRLLEMEVPEIAQGLVEIKAIAREAGKRAKVAVAALRDGVDPVGACVGLRGVRIQSIVRDLNDEKIDVIEWNPDPEAFIAKALSPARVTGVYLDEDPERGKTAIVVVPEDQLSLAIGRAGVNARLAARLTGWRIDIKSLPEAAMESLQALDHDPLLIGMAKELADMLENVETILSKKAEGRPVSPEEYQILASFVDRVQRALVAGRNEERRIRREKLEALRETIPASAYQTALEEVGISTRVLTLLQEAGYENAGQVMEDLGIDEDKILGIQGFGPKALKELKEKLAAFEFPVSEEPLEVEAEVEVAAQVGAEAQEGAPLLEAEAVAEGAAVEAEAEVLAEAEPAQAQPAAERAEATPEEAEALAEEGEPAPQAVEEDLEKVFESVAAQLKVEVVDEDLLEKEEIEEEEDELAPKKKRKKRKKIMRQVEYDPDLGETIVKRRRKRGEGDVWEDEFEF